MPKAPCEWEGPFSAFRWQKLGAGKAGSFSGPLKILHPHPDSATDLTGSVTPRGHSPPLGFDFSYVKKKGLGVGTPACFQSQVSDHTTLSTGF